VTSLGGLPPILSATLFLPATSICPNKLYHIKSKAMTAFLSNMGYPHTFLRAVAYAMTQQGGLGFFHLGHKQGVNKLYRYSSTYEPKP